MYLATFLGLTIVTVWTVPWIVREVEKMRVAPSVAFAPNTVAVGTIGAGAFFVVLVFLVFLVTRTLSPSQQEKPLVDAFLLNVNHRQDFAMMFAYATVAGGLVLWIKAALFTKP